MMGLLRMAETSHLAGRLDSMHDLTFNGCHFNLH
jgi:hypothetical protein